MAEPASTIHALLIGIDYYLPNRLYKSLKGAVRDIALVDTFLRQTLHIPPDRIRKLTSSSPEDKALGEARPAQDDQPTYANIVRAFHDITEQAQPEELVYIHYSGHGGRAATLYAELKGAGQNDEGIVPMDVGDIDGQYLRDVELATLLKRMTDKGLLVTVVLDSCHSGGTTRGDCEIRGAEQADTAPQSKDSLVAPREELIANWRSLTDRTDRTSWVPESRDYVLLAACRPTEFAFEYAVNGTDRYGALTYWMINTLTTVPGTLSYKTLHDRVCAKIQSKFANQLPMLLGEADRALFGSNLVLNQYTVIVQNVNAQQVKLSAGLANGLSRGTRFAIYPLNSADLTDKQKQVAIVEVINVGSSSSTASVLTAAAGGIDIRGSIESGAPAVMLAEPADLVRRVRLYDGKKLGEGENDLPTQAKVDQQSRALAGVRDALTDNGWVREVKDEEEGHYQVAIGKDGEYEICIGVPIENLNPPLTVGWPGAPEEVVKRLVHLAKYQAVQELDNPASALTKYLELALLDENDQPFPNQSLVNLKQGTLVKLRIKNTFAQPLNVAVLDLEPTWEISQIPLQGMDAPFYELAPQETIDTRLRLTAPEGKGYQQVKEMLKLFASCGAADFRWLKLPALDRQFELRASRGTRGVSSAFGKLLEAIGEDADVAPQITRAAVYEPDPNAEWVTKQIQIAIES